jgi:uncharacterized protein (TIGR02145 family)
MQQRNVLIFVTTLICSGLAGIQAQNVKDIDGYVYKTVTIGKQVWMAENLKTTKYNDSTTIQYVPVDTTLGSLTTDAYCNYDNNPVNSDTFGRLYNWYVVASTNPKNVCPKGWHVPTIADWKILISYVGGLGIAGGKLKEKGTIHWLKPNTGATNETAFTALPGGTRGSGTFDGIGILGFWWTNAEYNARHGWSCIMSNDRKDVMIGAAGKESSFSIRCLKD